MSEHADDLSELARAAAEAIRHRQDFLILTDAQSRALIGCAAFSWVETLERRASSPIDSDDPASRPETVTRTANIITLPATAGWRAHALDLRHLHLEIDDR